MSRASILCLINLVSQKRAMLHETTYMRASMQVWLKIPKREGGYWESEVSISLAPFIATGLGVLELGIFGGGGV